MNFRGKLLSMLGIALVMVSQQASATRAERSAENRDKAEAWCVNFESSHPGKACHVVKMAKLCPKGYRRAERFKQFRSRGYKACVPGSKGKVIGQTIKNSHKLPLQAIKQTTKKTTLGIGKATKKSTKATAKFIKKSTKFGVKGLRKTTPLP